MAPISRSGEEEKPSLGSGAPAAFGITGVGGALPERRLTNKDLEQVVDTSDEWIETRTGIKERRMAEAGVMTSDLAAEAARAALGDAGLEAGDVDLILVATSSPDMLFPSTASLVQRKLGGPVCAAFDILAACTGFCYAIAVASSYLSCGEGQRALVIGAEVMTRLVDWSDRGTCVLFGDGAAAVVLGEVPPEYGILANYMASDGTGADLLAVPMLPRQPDGRFSKQASDPNEVKEALTSASGDQGSSEVVSEGLKREAGLSIAGGDQNVTPVTADGRTEQFIKMNGQEVFKFAVKVLPEAARKVLGRAGLTIDAVDYFIPHQANKRIIAAATERLRIAPERVVSNIALYGNTSAASIPLAINDLWEAGRLKDGDVLLLAGFGGGLTWGANLIRWSRGGKG